MYTSIKYIKVPPDDHKLQVAITTDKPQYLPGDKAQYSIQVNDVAGKAVPRAEFSLGVVDEAIYAIRRDTTQDPLMFFFGREWNRVRTDDSMGFYFSGEAGKRRMQLAQQKPPTRLAQLKPDRLVQPKCCFGVTDVEEFETVTEHVSFSPPPELKRLLETSPGARGA